MVFDQFSIELVMVFDQFSIKEYIDRESPQGT